MATDSTFIVVGQTMISEGKLQLQTQPVARVGNGPYYVPIVAQGVGGGNNVQYLRFLALIHVGYSAANEKTVFMCIPSCLYDEMVKQCFMFEGDDQPLAQEPVARDDKWVKILLDKRKWKVSSGRSDIVPGAVELRVGGQKGGVLWVTLNQLAQEMPVVEVLVQARFSASVQMDDDDTVVDQVYALKGSNKLWRLGMTVSDAVLRKVVHDPPALLTSRSLKTAEPIRATTLKDADTIAALTRLHIYSDDTDGASEGSVSGA